jgi:hypothetical protein
MKASRREIVELWQRAQEALSANWRGYFQQQIEPLDH